MSRFRTHWLLPACALLASGLATPGVAQTPATTAATPGERPASVEPRRWLLEQVRLGEARHNEAMIGEALDKLAAIAPEGPDVLEARVRQALRTDDLPRAERWLTRLAEQAPDSPAYHRAASNVALARPLGRAALSQARLLAAAGRLEPARAAYDALFPAGPPTLPLALEYWELVARLPGGLSEATDALKALDTRYPRSPELGFTLARLLFRADRDAEARQRLAELAAEPGSHQAAARLWFDTLRGRPASEASVAAWQGFLGHFADTDYADEARRILDKQRALLADPAYQARQRGLARFKAQGDSAGESDIQRALAAYPDDVELLGALGIIRLREGRHDDALALFRRAQALDESGFSGDKWRSLIATANYWSALRRGDAALAEGHLDAAESAYRQATTLERATPDAWLGLGDVARRRGDRAAAERAYRQARRVAAGDDRALMRLAELYAEQSPQRALDFIDTLSSKEQRALADTRRRLRLTQLREAAQRFADAGQWPQAAERYTAARALAPDDVWLTYSLAQALRQADRQSQADDAFADLLTRLDEPEPRAQAHYAQALYLASSDRDAAALDSLARIPDLRRDDAMRELTTRLHRRQLLARADGLREAGKTAAARALLEAQPPSADLTLRLGDWALADGEPDVAERHYQTTLELAPNSRAARLGLAEAAVAAGDEPLARRTLEAFDLTQATIDERRRAADTWLALNGTRRAERALAPALEAPSAGNDALLWRDAARIARADDRPQRALERYRRGLLAADLAGPAALDDDATFTRATRSQAGDDWLASSLRSESAALYQSLDTRVRAARQVDNDSGTDGTSTLTTVTDMLEADTPFGPGRGFVRLDRVALDAGRLTRDADGQTRETFGTCAVAGCSGDFYQQDSGVSVGVGWYDETWRVDLGTTPLGFAVEDWVGGLRYDGDLGPLWLTATLSRRPLDDSLLAFAGTRDPRTGTTWGGIRATGISLGLGYDQGGANGVWSNLGVHHLSGENVPDNTRVQAMGGVYHKLINRDDARLSVGVSSLAMHYARELGGYSLGQGGYYSPQRYVSLSLPVNYTARHGDWSWQLEAAVSQSWSESDDSPRYPLGGETVAGLPDATATRTGGSGGGFGYSLSAGVERRLGDHWSAALHASLQQSEDYAPNSLNLTLRYSLGAWQGDLSMPPEELSPYAGFD